MLTLVSNNIARTVARAAVRKLRGPWRIATTLSDAREARGFSLFAPLAQPLFVFGKAPLAMGRRRSLNALVQQAL